MSARVLDELLGSDAARIAIDSGPSPFDFALEISDSTTVSFREIRDASSTSALALIRRFIIFLLWGVSHDRGRVSHVPVVVVRNGKVIWQVDQLAVPSKILDAGRMEGSLRRQHASRTLTAAAYRE